MCAVTREEASEDVLIRFARSPEGVVVPDLAAKLPGRGVWVTCSAATLGEAIKRKVFTRGFEEETAVPEALIATVDGLLRKQALNQLSLTRKAGLAVQGFMKVEEALRKGRARLLLHTEGASEDGTAKLNRLAAAETVIVNSFRSDEMDLAFGRPNVIHASIAAGGLADKLVIYLQRMQNFGRVDHDGLKGQK